MPQGNKKHFNKEISRPKIKHERNGFITEDNLIRKGTTMRKQINLYWQKRAEEKKRRKKIFTKNVNVA